MKRLIPAVAVLGLLAGEAHAQSALMLDGVSRGEIVNTTYRCTGATTALKLPSSLVQVTYHNAGQNSLALVPFTDGVRVFVNVISGSGARYVAGDLEWWEKGGEVRLSSVRAGGSNGGPAATCQEIR